MADFLTELAYQQAIAKSAKMQNSSKPPEPNTGQSDPEQLIMTYADTHKQGTETVGQTLARLANQSDPGLAGLYALARVRRGQELSKKSTPLAKADLEAAHERVLKALNEGKEPSAEDYAAYKQRHFAAMDYDDE